MAADELLAAEVARTELADVQGAGYTGDAIATHLTTTDVPVDAEEIIVTAGQAPYAERRAALAAALDATLFTFTAPDGGYFLWLQLPAGVSSSRAVAAAHDLGVDVSDGRKFFVNAAGSESVCVSFSMLSTELLGEGATRLNEAVRSLVH